MAEEKSLREILKDVYNAGLGCGIRKFEDYDECGRIDQALSAIEAYNKARRLSEEEIREILRNHDIGSETFYTSIDKEKVAHAIFKAQQEKDK